MGFHGLCPADEARGGNCYRAAKGGRSAPLTGTRGWVGFRVLFCLKKRFLCLYLGHCNLLI